MNDRCYSYKPGKLLNIRRYFRELPCLILSLLKNEFRSLNGTV
jgi:hypothetical protein